MGAEKTKRPGRPEGAQNRDYGQSIALPSVCPSCGSTERGEYTSRTEHEFEGIDPLGRPYNVIVWRSCECKTCGQWRRDKTFEMRAEFNGEPNI